MATWTRGHATSHDAVAVFSSVVSPNEPRSIKSLSRVAVRALQAALEHEPVAGQGISELSGVWCHTEFCWNASWPRASPSQLSHCSLRVPTPAVCWSSAQHTLSATRPSRASLEWTLWLPNLVPRACCALPGDVRSDGIPFPSVSLLVGVVVDAFPGAVAWAGDSLDEVGFGAMVERWHQADNHFFVVPRVGRRPPSSPHHMTRLLQWAGGPGLLLAGWLVLRSCKSALVDELLCGRTGPSSCRTAERR